MTDYKPLATKYDYAEIVRELRQDASTSRDLYLADAIEELSKQIKAVQCVNIGDLECDSNQLCTCMGIVRKRLEEDEKKPRWIPVTERLPSKNDRYLTASIEPWFGTTVIDTMRWSGVWMYDGRQTKADVTHWMPLPAPPEEEEE